MTNLVQVKSNYNRYPYKEWTTVSRFLACGLQGVKMREIMKDYSKINTRELLALYRKTKQHLSFGDMFEDEYVEEIEKEIAAMKKELNTREHIPNKAEAKKIRQEKARKK